MTIYIQGKLAMYFFFMSLVYVAFKDSFLRYPTKVLAILAFGFFGIMYVFHDVAISYFESINNNEHNPTFLGVS